MGGWDMALRLGLALGAGLVIGLERESHGRAAGLRTTVLACVAGAIAMILSESFYLEGAQMGLAWRPDPARLAAGLLTGMGFLGAGAIIREGNLVRGVTTAAVLWFVTILGLAFGSGHLVIGLVGFAIAVLVLMVLPMVERMVKNDWYSTLVVTCEIGGLTDQEIKRHLEDAGIKVKRVGLKYDREKSRRVIQLELKYKKSNLFDLSETTVQSLIQQPGVLQVQWN